MGVTALWYPKETSAFLDQFSCQKLRQSKKYDN